MAYTLLPAPRWATQAVRRRAAASSSPGTVRILLSLRLLGLRIVLLVEHCRVEPRIQHVHVDLTRTLYPSWSASDPLPRRPPPASYTRAKNDGSRLESS